MGNQGEAKTNEQQGPLCRVYSDKMALNGTEQGTRPYSLVLFGIARMLPWYHGYSCAV